MLVEILMGFDLCSSERVNKKAHFLVVKLSLYTKSQVKSNPSSLATGQNFHPKLDKCLNLKPIITQHWSKARYGRDNTQTDFN